MIFSIYAYGFYCDTNQMLIRMHNNDLEKIKEDWQDEASEAAVAGKPEKAMYVEHMIKRVFG